MPSANADFVRRVFETFPRTQRGYREGTLPIGPPIAEDVVWDASVMRLPDTGDGVFRGREGVRRFWMAWLSAWEELRFQFEIFESGDRVLAVIDQEQVASGMAIPLRYAQVWTFKQGEVVHWKVYTDLPAAFAAAGLPE